MIQYIKHYLATTSILIFLTIIIILFEFNAFSWISPAHINHLSDIEKNTFLVCFTALCYFIAPLVIGRYIFQESPANLGFALPKNKRHALFLMLGSLVLLAPWLHFFATIPSFKTYYSIESIDRSTLLITQLILMPLYYVFEEFFFRGFLFIGLWKRVGWHSFWITDIIFTWAHFSKPGLEILMCIPASIILNYITLKTRSIVPAICVHYTIGVLVTIFVNYS